MLNFSNFLIEEFLIEAAGKAMAGNFRNVKGRSHVKAYIMPFLSKQQKIETAKNLTKHVGSDEIDTSSHGELYNPDKNATTHEIVAKTGHVDSKTGERHAQGTKVRVTGVRHTPDDQIIVQTANHGEIPLSKLGTPAGLARSNKTSEGFGIERILQSNIDPRYKPAGSTGESWDFVAGNPKEEDKSVRGKAVKSDESKVPEFRGEAKASTKGTVAMGTSSINFDKNSRTWSFANPKVAEKFAEARHPKSGLKLLDHLNKHHKDGTISTGFTVEAPKGTAEHYLKSVNANALHLHRYAKNSNGEYTMNHGTSYTIGDDNPFANKLGLGHLSYDDLGQLDGKLVIEKTTSGVTQVKHRPSPTIFKKLADASRSDPENHRDLTRQEHAEEFKQKLINHLGSETPSQETLSQIPFVRQPHKQKGVERLPQTGSPMVSAPTPGVNPDAEHGGRRWFTPQEKSIMKGNM